MDRIGEYLVRRLIGEGGMGKVYEAEERLSKRRVALKVLRPELTRHEDGRRLFLNEMQILAHLEHPNLVRSLASMETDGQLVMVLEYLNGRTLRQELTRRGALPWQEALEHVARIAEALTVAHEQEPPIVHRDLKPENVMLTVGEGAGDDAAPTGLKVMDFGIAKVLEGIHGTNTQSIGTLQYMSPEQIDARTIDARSDLYSLGLLFYELISGDPPFSSASPRELLNLQCTAPAPALDEEVRRGLPRGVEDMLFAMLEKKPEDRPSSAREVSERLSLFRAAGAAATSGRPSRARPSRTGDDQRVSAPPPRMADAPERPAAGASGNRRTGPDTHHPGRDDEAKRDRPRTDTIALVEANASRPREVPTWLAVIAIVALSLVAGMTTYLVRLKMTTDTPPAPTASADGRAARSIGAGDTSGAKR
jgi:eukaryotic-like serine/threonine-protein kinase